jgi:hypothetical protein
MRVFPYLADFAIPVALAIVETGLAHAALHCAHSRQHPPAGTKWQLTRVRAETGAFHETIGLGFRQRRPHQSRARSSHNPVGFVELVPWHNRRIRLTVIQRPHH